MLFLLCPFSLAGFSRGVRSSWLWSPWSCCHCWSWCCCWCRSSLPWARNLRPPNSGGSTWTLAAPPAATPTTAIRWWSAGGWHMDDASQWTPLCTSLWMMSRPCAPRKTSPARMGIPTATRANLPWASQTAARQAALSTPTVPTRLARSRNTSLWLVRETHTCQSTLMGRCSYLPHPYPHCHLHTGFSDLRAITQVRFLIQHTHTHTHPYNHMSPWPEGNNSSKLGLLSNPHVCPWPESCPCVFWGVRRGLWDGTHINQIAASFNKTLLQTTWIPHLGPVCVIALLPGVRSVNKVICAERRMESLNATSSNFWFSLL